MQELVEQPAIKFIKFLVTKVVFDIGKLNDNSSIHNPLKVSLDLTNGFNETNNQLFTINFEVIVYNVDNKFNITVLATSVFETNKPIDDEFKNSPFIEVNAPAIAFPFVRSFINTLSSNAGLNPIILPSFNFARKIDK